MMDTECEWIEWSGGECPVAQDALVYTRRGDGFVDKTPETAGWWDGDGTPESSNWKCGDRHQITAYRVVPA